MHSDPFPKLLPNPLPPATHDTLFLSLSLCLSLCLSLSNPLTPIWGLSFIK